MKSIRLFGVGAMAILAVAALVEQRQFDAGRQTAMGAIDPGKVTFAPAPINADWVIEGKPVTEAAEIAHTDDGTTKVYVWKTTKSRFHWNYDSDEVVTVLDGEVFVADGSGIERRLGPGDVAFFPVGAKTLWRVPDHLRKIAVLKRPVPGPFANVLRWIRSVKSWVKPSQAFAAN